METEQIAKPIKPSLEPTRILYIAVVLSLVLGSITGFVLSKKQPSQLAKVASSIEKPKSASQDNQTFKDFAEGTIKAKPTPKNPGQYAEGTHVLERENAVPVALTSSVIDLSKYEGKKVKVYGETQKALEEGWLMDVGKVEEIK